MKTTIVRARSVAVAVVASGRSYGWLLLGPRESRRRYLRPDLATCRQCARRCARLLDRLRLISEKAEQARRFKGLDLPPVLPPSFYYLGRALEERIASPFMSVADFVSRLQTVDDTLSVSGLGVASDYFLLTTRVVIGGVAYAQRSLISRRGAQYRVEWRVRLLPGAQIDA